MCIRDRDIIDTAISPFALGTSQPATEVMVETFKGTPYDTGFDQQLLAEIADYFRPIRDEALDSGLLNPKNLGVNIKTLLYQVPGGMLSNLTSQLKEDVYKRQVRELGRLDAPGRPILLGTTEEFLRSFGVQALDELPVMDPVQLEDFKAEAEEEIQLKLDV